MTLKQAQIELLMFIISVFVADEYQRDKTAIPVYNHLINNNATQINIKLKEREYYFTIKNFIYFCRNFLQTCYETF